MVLIKSPDGRSYGRYQQMGDGSFGFVPVIAAAVSALPAIMAMFNPQQPAPPPPPPEPDNTLLYVGAGLGGLLILGGVAYAVMK